MRRREREIGEGKKIRKNETIRDKKEIKVRRGEETSKKNRESNWKDATSIKRI